MLLFYIFFKTSKINGILIELVVIISFNRMFMKDFFQVEKYISNYVSEIINYNLSICIGNFVQFV